MCFYLSILRRKPNNLFKPICEVRAKHGRKSLEVVNISCRILSSSLTLDDTLGKKANNLDISKFVSALARAIKMGDD